jgi:SAM-dependent methyltransferase
VGGWVLPFRDGSFDAVMALEVLEHLAEDEALLSEAARVLRPGGLAVISVPLHMALWSATDEACAHVRRYEPDELFDKLSRCGFRIERYHLRPGRCHPVMARVGHGLLFRLPRLSNWWLQNVVFAFQSGWHRRFGRLRWAPVDRPPERDAAGITVVATKPLTR